MPGLSLETVWCHSHLLAPVEKRHFPARPSTCVTPSPSGLARLDPPFLQVFEGLPDDLEDGEAEGARLSRPRLSCHEDVSPAQDQRDGFGLDVGGQGPSHVVHSLADLGEDPKLCNPKCSIF